VCGNQLVINGTFMADSLKLGRTAFSRSKSTPGEYPDGPVNLNCGQPVCAAEVFNFSPETYLSAPAFAPKQSQQAGSYDSINNLPPSL
jgi:hypothetical protein